MSKGNEKTVPILRKLAKTVSVSEMILTPSFPVAGASTQHYPIYFLQDFFSSRLL